MLGTVKHWNAQRGFGFIRPDEGGEDVFAHVTQLVGARELLPDQRVEFGTKPGRKGGDQAVGVRILS